MKLFSFCFFLKDKMTQIGNVLWYMSNALYLSFPIIDK